MNLASSGVTGSRWFREAKKASWSAQSSDQIPVRPS